MTCHEANQRIRELEAFLRELLAGGQYHSAARSIDLSTGTLTISQLHD